jgi:hypothetical protein
VWRTQCGGVGTRTRMAKTSVPVFHSIYSPV